MVSDLRGTLVGTGELLLSSILHGSQFLLIIPALCTLYITPAVLYLLASVVILTLVLEIRTFCLVLCL